MSQGKRREEVTLLDLLIDGFEKNEMFDGFHERLLPMPDVEAAKGRFVAFAQEAVRWKGSPVRAREQAAWQLLAWPDLELLQAGRVVAVRAKAPRFSDWWNDLATWQGDPMHDVFSAWDEARASA